jgi:hypothetical protein
LKERERTWIKLLSIVLAIAGAILIEISHWSLSSHPEYRFRISSIRLHRK